MPSFCRRSGTLWAKKLAFPLQSRRGGKLLIPTSMSGGFRVRRVRLSGKQSCSALSVCRLDYGSWELYTAPCGLTQLVRRPEEIYTGADTEHVYIQLILSDDDAPLYFNYQNDLGQGDTLADDAVAQYCTLLGLDEFADWQYPDWGTAVRDFGAAGYSETAQVYAVANANGYSVTLSAASMTPQTFAALNTQYGEGTS